jgi:dodecin
MTICTFGGAEAPGRTIDGQETGVASPHVNARLSASGGTAMSESVYTFTEVVGTSTESWEKAATTAVERAARTLRDLRVAEVVKLDLDLEDGRVRAYRARVQISFKLEE